MTNNELLEVIPRCQPGIVAYFRLLNEARHISEQALERLHALETQFPTARLGKFIEQGEYARADLPHERRCSPRLEGGHQPANVSEQMDLSSWSSAVVIDYSVGGLSLLLDHPEAVDSILLVELVPSVCAEDWLPVEVRHCRQEGENWVIGCEFLIRPDLLALQW